MRSLRMKMVMIMVILILALMLTTGAFLMSGVGNFYVSQFYEQMEETFTPEFIVQLQRLSEEDNAPAQMKALLMAQAGLGIDITGRNVYILDQTGSVLDSSNQKTSVAMTQNILSAMNGEVGQSSAITNNYMDLAVPVDAASGSYIAYIRLSVSFYKYRKSIWLDFRQQSFSACRFTVVTVCILFLNGTFSILAPIFIRTIVGAAATAMVVFRAKAARQATSCNSKFSFHAYPPLNSVFPHPLHIQKRIRIAFLVKL